MFNELRIPAKAATALAMAGLAGLIACGGGGSSNATPSTPVVTPTTAFVITAYVSDQAGAAANQDPSLVNGWGLATGPATPFWVANQGSRTSTVYNGYGVAPSPSQAITVPVGASAGPAQGPTGIIYNGTANFSGDVFILASLDGTITGWTSGAAAAIRRDNSAAGAQYTGLASGASGTTPYLYAANFGAGTVDVFDAAYAPASLGASAFTDPAIPAGFYPFNIQNLASKLYVTYAQRSATNRSVSGAGLGYVDVFGTDGTLTGRLVSQGPLNAPWGLAIAPSGFGAFGGALLVGNFGDGRITAFNATTGASMGQLSNASGTPISVDGLWGILFGNGTAAGGVAGQLYFASGPSSESHGLFGTISFGAPASAGGAGGGTGVGY